MPLFMKDAGLRGSLIVVKDTPDNLATFNELLF